MTAVAVVVVGAASSSIDLNILSSSSL